MYMLAISKFDIPGEHGFPLNAVYSKPASAQEGGKLSAIRQALEFLPGIIKWT